MDYSKLNTIKQLADLLRCKSEFIESIITYGYYVVERDSDSEYEFWNKVRNKSNAVEKFGIRKKNKSLGYRIIHKPLMHNLVNTLKILNSFLSIVYIAPENVQGFIKGKNILTNANLHLSKKYILSLDIANFFDNISEKMVKESLITLGFTCNVAGWIASIVTVDGYLVQGFNTSPTVANIVAKGMDNDLIEKCNNSIDYTRYADDMYFSSNYNEPSILGFETIINKHGFTLNHKKTQLMKRGQNQYVTGLTVFDNITPRISKKVKRNLRLEIYYITKYGYTNHIIRKFGYSRKQLKNPIIRQRVYSETIDTENRIWGWIHFIQSIEPILGEKLEQEFKKPKRKMYSKYILSCKANARLNNDDIVSL